MNGLPRTRAATVVEHSILFRQTVSKLHGDARDCRDARFFFEQLRRRCQQRCIATEFVEHKAFDQLLLVFRQQRPGAIQVGKSAAPVNVRHQQAVRIAVFGHAHVHHITGMQIDLGRRSCSFDHHHIVFGTQLVQCLSNLRPHFQAAATPGHGAQLVVDLTKQHDLAARIGLGLEQQGVHAHIGHRACGQGLQVLGCADLAPLTVGRGDNTGVIAHVLRLERRDLQALAAVVGAQRRGHPAFACATAGAQHHDATCCHVFNFQIGWAAPCAA